MKRRARARSVPDLRQREKRNIHKSIAIKYELNTMANISHSEMRSQVGSEVCRIMSARKTNNLCVCVRKYYDYGMEGVVYRANEIT